jgi:hypothetical protein
MHFARLVGGLTIYCCILHTSLVVIERYPARTHSKHNEVQSLIPRRKNNKVHDVDSFSSIIREIQYFLSPYID